MLDKLNDSFVANGNKWEYIPNNKEDIALFDGNPTVSKRVMELIGKSGVEKIDEILKGMKRAKEMIYGTDSIKVGFSMEQYFTTIPETQKNRTLPYIFKTNEIIICDAGICGAFWHSSGEDSKDFLKKESFEAKDIISRWTDKRPFRDYAVYVIDDIRELIDSEFSYWEWKKIQNKDEKVLKNILGTRFLSDHL